MERCLGSYTTVQETENGLRPDPRIIVQQTSMKCFCHIGGFEGPLMHFIQNLTSNCYALGAGNMHVVETVSGLKGSAQ